MQTYGLFLSMFQITNPFGLILKHKINELSINRKDLAHKAGIPPENINYLSILTSPKNRSASFATNTGPALIETILDIEAANKQYLPKRDKQNFPKHRKDFMDAMTLLSLYSYSCKHGTNPHALFTRFSSIVTPTVYTNAMTYVGEAIQGPVSRETNKHPLSMALWSEKIERRRHFAGMIPILENHSIFDDLFVSRAKALIDKNDTRQALLEMIEGYENR